MSLTVTPVEEVDAEVADRLVFGLGPDHSSRQDHELSEGVAEPSVGDSPDDQRPEVPFGPILISSVINASVAFFVITGVAMWLISGGVWDGIGLGAFCAFWGGPGFGLMAAGAKWTHLQERAAHG